MYRLTTFAIRYIYRPLDPIYSQNSRSDDLTELSIHSGSDMPTECFSLFIFVQNSRVDILTRISWTDHSKNSRSNILTDFSVLYTHRPLDLIYLQKSRSNTLTKQIICILTELSQNSRSYALAELSVRYTHRTTLDPKHSHNSRYDTFDILTELSMWYTQRAPRADILTTLSI